MGCTRNPFGDVEKFLCAPPLLQAVPELMTAATLAFQDKSSQEVGQAKQNWKDVAARFWLDQKEMCRDVKQKKLKRTKVFQWLMATSHMLMVACGVGWSAFQLPEQECERPSPWNWPCVVCSLDQGGDGWSAG